MAETLSIWAAKSLAAYQGVEMPVFPLGRA